MDPEKLLFVALVTLLGGFVMGVVCMYLYRGTRLYGFTFSERFQTWLKSALLTSVFFGLFGFISGPKFALYWLVGFGGILLPVALFLLPNWFGVYNKKEE